MSNFTTGKIKAPIEIQHFDGNVTFCFVFLDHLKDLYSYMAHAEHFIPIMLVSGEFIYIARTDIKAFRLIETQKMSEYSIWSFDPYTILGVEEHITMEELSAHYKSLLQMVHPDIIDQKNIHDVFKDIAKDITKRIINAYEQIKRQNSH